MRQSGTEEEAECYFSARLFLSVKITGWFKNACGLCDAWRMSVLFRTYFYHSVFVVYVK